MNITINIHGVSLEVSGDFYEGCAPTYDHPGDPAEFEVHQVYYNGMDVTELIEAVYDVDHIADKVIEELV